MANVVRRTIAPAIERLVKRRQIIQLWRLVVLARESAKLMSEYQ
jgi:hypothetical protein